MQVSRDSEAVRGSGGGLNRERCRLNQTIRHSVERREVEPRANQMSATRGGKRDMRRPLEAKKCNHDPLGRAPTMAQRPAGEQKEIRQQPAGRPLSP